MKTHTTYIICLITLITVCQCAKYGKLAISSPSQLINIMGNSSKDLKFTLANFGEVHFGKSFQGEVVIADPIEACEQLKNKQDVVSSKIILASRGNCSFVTKSYYAQLAGANLLITVNSADSIDVSHLLIINDGSGLANDIRIPSIMINYKEGKQIQDYLTQNTNQTVLLQVNFEWPQSETAQIMGFISVSDPYSYQMLQELQPYFNKLNKINSSIYTFDPYYVIWHCVECEVFDKYEATYNLNCLSGGRYCAPDPDGDGPLTGRDVVNEVLVQLCIKEQYGKNLWWQYVNSYGDLCFAQNKNLPECSNSITQKLSFDQDSIQQCINSSFNGTDRLLNDNKLLKQQRQKVEEYKIVIWPTLFINNMTYRGNLIGDYMFEVICDSLLNPPGVCQEQESSSSSIVNRISMEEPENVENLLVTIISGLSVFLCIFFIYYRRKLKRDMHKEMTLQISSAVSHYVRMNETSFDGKATKDKQNFVEAQYV